MAKYKDLPTELRLSILEYVVCSFAWLDPPDVDDIRRDDWFYPPQPPARQIHPITWHAHRSEPHELLKSLRLVSKTFDANVKYVWKQLVEPKLSPILNVDCVSHGIHTYRPLTGILVKWLCLPTSFVNIGSIEVRIRYLDQELKSDGDGVSPNRTMPKRIPSPLGADWLHLGLQIIIDRLRRLVLPGLANQHPFDAFAGVKTLRLVFQEALPDGLHWMHSDVVKFKHPSTRVPISAHPYLSIAEMMRNENQPTRFDKDCLLPLDKIEFYVDDSLVFSCHRGDGNSVVHERHPYTMPVDPLCVP